MYFCGSTVYQRIHVGNSRPFVLGMWLRSWLREHGLRRHARAQHHGRRRQGLRRGREAGDLEPRAQRAGDGLVLRGHGWPRVSGDPTSSREPPRRSRRSSSSSEELVCSAILPTWRTATCTSASRAIPEYGQLSGARIEDMVAQETSELKEDQRDFALWKGQKPIRRRSVGLAVGPRPAGLAHRVLGDGGEVPRPRVRDSRRRQRSALPSSRERARAVEEPRARLRANLDAQRNARVGCVEDVEIARQRRDAAQRARRLGSRGAARLSPLGPLGQARRLLRRRDATGLGPRQSLSRRLPAATRGCSSRRLGPVSRRRSRTTSTPRLRLR